MSTKTRLGHLLAVSMEEARAAETAEQQAAEQAATDAAAADAAAAAAAEEPAAVADAGEPAPAAEPAAEPAAAEVPAAADDAAVVAAAEPVVTDAAAAPAEEPAAEPAAAPAEEPAPAAAEEPAAAEPAAADAPSADAASTSQDAEPAAAGEERPADADAVSAEKLVVFQTSTESDGAAVQEVAAAAEVVEDATVGDAAAPAPAEEPAPTPAAEEPAAPAADETRTEDAPAADAAADAAAPASDEPAADAVIEVADPDTLEADLVEIGEAAAAVDENSEAVQELTEIQEGLESIAASLEAAALEGGLTPQASVFMRLAVESYTSRLGEENTVPSMESFGGQTTRVSATNVSLESVQETLAKVWAAIKAIIAKVKDAIVDFFKKLLLGTEKLKARAEQVKAAAGKVAGGPKAEKVDLGSTAAKLAVGHNLKIDGTSLAALIDLAKQAQEYDEASSKILVGDYERVRKFAAGDESAVSFTDVHELAAPKAFSKKSGDKVLLTPVLPGNVSFSFERYDFKLLGRDLNVFVAAKHSENGQPASTEIAPLSAAEISKIADECLELVKVVEAGQKAVAANAKTVKAGLKDLKISKNLSGEQAANAKVAINTFKMRATQQDQATTKILGYVITTARAYLAAAEKSLSTYGSGELVPAAA